MVTSSLTIDGAKNSQLMAGTVISLVVADGCSVKSIVPNETVLGDNTGVIAPLAT